MSSHEQTCKHESSSSLDFQDIVATGTSVMMLSVTSVLSLPIMSCKPYASHTPLTDQVSEPQCRREREESSHLSVVPASNQALMTVFLANCCHQSSELQPLGNGTENFSLPRSPAPSSWPKAIIHSHQESLSGIAFNHDLWSRSPTHSTWVHSPACPAWPHSLACSAHQHLPAQLAWSRSAAHQACLDHNDGYASPSTSFGHSSSTSRHQWPSFSDGKGGVASPSCRSRLHSPRRVKGRG